MKHSDTPEQDFSKDYSSLLQQIEQEVQRIPPEYGPALLHLVRMFCKGTTPHSVKASFRRGWQEAMSGQTLPISML
jgi:hypothetical protein